MGKAEKGTPKYLANKMKAKGLQKLRWYCQMCEKQCRDENGFKCHTMSESHQRQLLLFAEDPDKYLDSYSEEFYEEYTNLLKRRFGTKRVQANNVYQEYIHDRDHVHMNATQWETLTEFVKWLGREGHCIVDETEKGWYVTYIDRDPETVMRNEKLIKKEKHEMNVDQKREAFIEKQVKLGLERAKDVPEAVFTDLKRDGEEPIKLNLAISSVAKTVPASSALKVMEDKSKGKFAKPEAKKTYEKPKKRSALEEIMDEERRKKTRWSEESSPAPSTMAKKDDPWVSNDIIVKIVTKNLGSRYYKQKAVVVSVVEDYVAKVKLLECGTKMKLDQTHLETVVPSVGRAVMVVAGAHRGCRAVLQSLQQDTFSATIKMAKDDTIVHGVPYEHFSKLHVS